MYAVEVREHIMIAHSLPGEVFGPAQKLHGATYVVDVAFFRSALDPDAIVVDIGRLHSVLKETLAPINYANLDELDAFKGVVTTTEYLARWIFDRLAEAAGSGALGPNAGGLEKLRVTLNESHIAKAWYEGSL